MSPLRRLARVLAGRRTAPVRHPLRVELLESRELLSVDLRIATYNITVDARPGLETVLRAMGDQVVNGVSRPVDVIALQEVDSQATDTQAVVNLLNGIYGSGTYARGSVDGASTGAGTQGVVYRTSTIQLLSETAFGASVAGGVPRQVLRYNMRPIGYSTTNDFYLYVAHPKASTGSSNVSLRNAEAQAVRASMDALPQGTNIIYASDTNFYTNTESGWNTFTSAGNGQLVDPINRVGSWTGNSSFADVHTQSPTTTARFPGQITGGMDDRFDMQLVSGELLDGSGLDILPATYRVLGNNGTTFDQSVDSPNNTWVWSPVSGSTVTRSTLLTALASVTDHMPVIADYDIIGTGDTTPPTIAPANFVDNVSGGPVLINQTVTYTLTFSEDILNGSFTAADLNNAGTAAISIGTITETSAGVFTVQVTPTTAGTLILRIPTGAVVTDVAGNALSGLPIADNTTITVNATETTPPTVAAIDDGDADNLVPAGVALAYTVTFSEDIINTGGGAFTAADLNNAGTAAIAVGTITETSPGVFTVPVTPTTAGTLILRIPTGAVVTDLAGNALAVPVSDNDTVTVDATAPTIAAANFVDNVGGGPLVVNQTVTYTLTFSEDILNGSLTAADLNNAGSATVAIGTITETSPGVFTVQVTPTSAGTLILRIPTGAVVQDVAGNALGGLPIADDTTVTVNAPLATFAVITTTLLDGGAGFLVTFNGAYDIAALNLYTGDAGGTLDARDVQVVGPGGIDFGVAADEFRFHAVPVSATQLALVVSGPNRVAAAGLLPAGGYAVTLQGGTGSPAFKRLSDGAFLDGNGNGTVAADDDYVGPTLTAGAVAANAAVFSVADVAAGPGQTVDVPLVATNDVNDLRSVGLTIDTNPLYGEVLGFTINPAIPGGSATFNTSSGFLGVTATAPFAATDAPFLIGTFQVQVPGLVNPGTAPGLGNKGLLDLTVSAATDAAGQPKPFLSDDGVHVVAYLGDVTSPGGVYNGLDVSQLQSLLVGSASALAAYQNVDPRLLADVNKDGTLNGIDVSNLQSRVVGGASVIPPLPLGAGGVAATGPDPVLFLGAAFTADGRPAALGRVAPGDTVVVPVSVFVTERTGITLTAADVVVRFDPAVFALAGVTRGAGADGSLGGGAFSVLYREVSPGSVRITGSTFRGPAMAFGQTAVVYYLTLTVKPDARAGRAAVNLLADDGALRSGLYDNQLRSLLLLPAPTNAATDDVDAVVTILGRRAALDTGRRAAPAVAPVLAPAPSRTSPVRADRRGEPDRIVAAPVELPPEVDDILTRLNGVARPGRVRV